MGVKSTHTFLIMYKAIYTHPQTVHKEYKQTTTGSTELGSELYLITQMFEKKSVLNLWSINEWKSFEQI